MASNGSYLFLLMLHASSKFICHAFHQSSYIPIPKNPCRYVQGPTKRSLTASSRQPFQPLKTFTRRHSDLKMSSAQPSGSFHSNGIENVEHIYVISDLHTDNTGNLKWLKERCSTSSSSMQGQEQKQTPGRNDALIIAGDISHEFSKIEETLNIIQESLQCHIFFIWGNHEAWVGGSEMDEVGIETSLEKIDAVNELCKRLGIYTEFELVGIANEYPALIVPIESWYDGTLSLDGCEDLCDRFNTWPWVDFRRCEWPDRDSLKEMAATHSDSTYAPNYCIDDREIGKIGRIPLGLTELLAHKNMKSISDVQSIYQNWEFRGGDVAVDEPQDESNGKMNTSSKPISDTVGEEQGHRHRRKPGLITYSHFLPNEKCLPDWKDPQCEVFQREEWLDHPVPDISAKFAKVSGSVLIDEQIRSILPKILSESASESVADDTQQVDVQHLHIFGHSHRPKDFVYEGIRYIHNPLGKPREREMKMVSSDVDFQLIWDCTKDMASIELNEDLPEDVSYAGGLGEVPG